MTPDEIELAKRKLGDLSRTVAEIAEEFNVHRSTLYAHIPYLSTIRAARRRRVRHATGGGSNAKPGA
jgi:predicted transcriptional regulator